MKITAALALVASTATSGPAAALIFNPGDLVVSVEGRGYGTGSYADNQASPLTLAEFTTAGAFVGSMELTQTSDGPNAAISAEYGSSSEAILQRSSDGRSLTVMGYGVNAAAFNADPTAYGTLTTDPTKPNALGQSGSLTGQGYTPVARVVALIGADGAVDTTTQLYNIYNGNNPRSVFTADGRTFYTSGQGVSGDTTGGVYYAQRGATSAAPITGKDTNGKTQNQDTRVVSIYNNTLYVSADTKSGSGNNRDFIGTLGSPPATSVYGGDANGGGSGPTMLPGFGNSKGTGKLTLSAGQANGLNAGGQEINLSPESFFFANATTLYVADSGAPKNDSVVGDAGASRLGDGGLQKWSLVNGSWVLDYTLADGLDLVANATADPTHTAGTTGLLGLTGKVVGDIVELFATNYTIGDTDQTYLYGIDDLLGATAKPNGESFVQLAAAPADSNFKGVAFAPEAGAVPEPATWATMIAGFGLVGAATRRRRAAGALNRAG